MEYIFNYLFYSFHSIVISLVFLNLILNMIFILMFKLVFIFKLVFYLMVLFISFWLFDLVFESKTGVLNNTMKDFFKYGFLLFIFSEFMFFFSIFWFYFDSGLNQEIDIFECWVPSGIIFINPFSMPLMNTFILLSSGFSVTIFHMNLMKNKMDLISMVMTLLLGVLFLFIQKMEYQEMMFSMKDSLFGSIFFFSTGFHGIHVFLGVSFLLINFIRVLKNDFFMKNLMSMEFSIIYWHFVDVVWLFLFVFIYWWTY